MMGAIARQFTAEAAGAGGNRAAFPSLVMGIGWRRDQNWEAPMRSAKWLLLATMAVATAAAANAQNRQAEANAAFTEYPRGSLADNEQGIVHYRVKIDRRGMANECAVTRSSGFQRLDNATCDLLMTRARFTPSRDSRGRASRSTFDGRVIWRIG
jgi:TonB family protein